MWSRFWRRVVFRAVLIAVPLAASGCDALLREGTADAAGAAGGIAAGALTKNAAVATGIGLGVRAGANAAMQYTERRIHRATQDRIAETAGPLKVGAVSAWQSKHDIPVEPDEQGQVTVSRLIGNDTLRCKEIVFSVDGEKGARAFYIAAICQDGQRWKWASAEPATERWGSLQ